MLLRKINRGLYEVMDTFENNYIVQDSRVPSAKSLPNFCKTKDGYWTVWYENPYQINVSTYEDERMELDESYVFINNDKTLKDCLFSVALLEEAQEIITKED
tara:strand:- start:3327 stop:3632 length:306 start_codon:yes stop_codon:yes gene_type:complete